MSDYINSNIQLWRMKAADGTLTKEEMREAIAAIRASRIGADAVSAKSKEKKATAATKKATIVDTGSLLNELDGL